MTRTLFLKSRQFKEWLTITTGVVDAGIVETPGLFPDILTNVILYYDALCLSFRKQCGVYVIL